MSSVYVVRRRSGAGSFVGCGGSLFVLFIISCFLLFLAGWTETNLEWGLGKIAGRPIDVPYWLAAVATFFTNLFGVAFNILCELAKLVFP